MHGTPPEDWVVHLVDTGDEVNTGGRLKRLESWLGNEPFMVTYGDGVSNIDLDKLIELHRAQGCIGTVTAVRPPARYGGILFDGDAVDKFTEKSQVGEGWINGGYLVFEPAIFRYLKNDQSSLEAHVLEKLASENQLSAYRHHDFWQCMDTIRDKLLLQHLWQQGGTPWKVWE